MRLLLLLLTVALLAVHIQCAGAYQEEDNEFAEFEDFDDEDQSVKSPVTEGTAEQTKSSSLGGIPPVLQDEEEEEEIDTEEESDEFEHFHDDEEFEGFDSENVITKEKIDERDAPKITITKVPLHLRTNWDSFYMEMLMVAGLAVYFLNFFTGRNKNQRLANAWLNSHKQLLEDNFTLVGDDGKVDNENPGFVKDSEHVYSLWCSGRVCCEGMLVELKFLKRQDLIAVMSQMIRPSNEQVSIRVDMSREDMDSFVFCVAAKKSAFRLSKDMADISLYCPERRMGDKFGLPANFNVMSEISEVSSAMLDSRITAVFNKYVDQIDYIHFSDQYSGPKQPEDANLVKLPDVKRVLLFAFNIRLKDQKMQQAMEQMVPLMQMVFYFMDKIKRFRLSKEGKNKAERNRLRVEEAFLKTTHAARAEAAAARKEEKRRQEKERILQEDDPEKQRKWEERDLKRQMKKKAPKLKQLKVKAL